MSEYVLSILLIATNVYWAYICSGLVNRLMSRNFYEFKAAERKPERRAPELVQEERDEYAEAQASELNSLMNLG